MKKRVAILANGWNSENLFQYVQGLFNGIPNSTIDYYAFLCHATYTVPDALMKSVSSIYELPDFSLFDAIIIFTPGLNFKESIDLIVERARNSGIPVISVGVKYEDFYFVGTDNYVGMKALCSHIIEEHGVKHARYIAGPRENDDSNERLEAIRDSFSEHGIQFTDDLVFYSDWELLQTAEYVNRLCKSGEELPDAFICANDFLAEQVCYSLTKNGIQTPEDVIVTGFDFTEEGKLFYPSIASVNQHYDVMGKVTANIISRVLHGEEVTKDNSVICEFRPGESCGCTNCNHEDELRRMYARSISRRAIEDDHTEGRRDRLTTTIIEANSYSDLKNRLKKNFSEESGIEGDTFFCMLDPKLSMIAENDISGFPKYTFAEEMDVVVSKVNGQHMELERIKTKKLLPDAIDEKENHIYTFIPIYFETFVCGYMVFTDKIDWFFSRMYYKFERSCASSISLYRRNVQVTELNKKMSELMERDPLTKVKNRMAYERYVSMLEKKFGEGQLTEFAVVYFDINNLKLVNDSLGHEFGDIYIQNCSNFICSCYKHSPVFRIGGDEFVTVLTGEDFENRHKILNQMGRTMDCRNKGEEPDIEHVSIAYGMAEYNTDKGVKFKSVFKRADELMYQNKAAMKNGDIR